MQSFLIQVLLPDLSLEATVRTEMDDTENCVLVWNDEIEPIDDPLEPGMEVVLDTFPSKHPTTVNQSFVDNDINGLHGIIQMIIPEENCSAWKHVHRPYIGEFR